MTIVHLHEYRPVKLEQAEPGCVTVCGLPCGTRETTAYRDLDPERVTCPACLAGAGATCRHCGRGIVCVDGAWIDPEAPADSDDAIWRETCDRHDTFTAEHEPVTS